MRDLRGVPPVRPLPAPAPAPSDAAERVPSWRSAPGERLRILVVDDEPDIRRMLGEALAAHLDAEVLAVEDAHQAQRLVASSPCDVVLLDHLLPGLEGSELLSWMTKNRLTARTLIITALPDDVLSTPSLLLRGAAGVLRKPVDLQELLASVRRVAPLRARGKG